MSVSVPTARPGHRRAPTSRVLLAGLAVVALCLVMAGFESRAAVAATSTRSEAVLVSGPVGSGPVDPDPASSGPAGSGPVGPGAASLTLVVVVPVLPGINAPG